MDAARSFVLTNRFAVGAGSRTQYATLPASALRLIHDRQKDAAVGTARSFVLTNRFAVGAGSPAHGRAAAAMRSC